MPYSTPVVSYSLDQGSPFTPLIFTTHFQLQTLYRISSRKLLVNDEMGSLLGEGGGHSVMTYFKMLSEDFL
jgi:hypothetical protein